jgi:transcription initiation factor TFIID subunit 2
VWAPELDEDDREVLDLATAEIDRYREMDRLNPSSHNVISIAILEVCFLLSFWSNGVGLDVWNIDL